MPSPGEISSLTASLDELTRRVTNLAEVARSGNDEDTASELFAVERALQGALRRLTRLHDDRR